MDTLEKQVQIPVNARADLAGLSSHDIWALNDFVTNKIKNKVSDLNPARRVAARVLVDLDLLVVVGEGAEREVIPTALGKDVLRVANSLEL